MLGTSTTYSASYYLRHRGINTLGTSTLGIKFHGFLGVYEVFDMNNEL